MVERVDALHNLTLDGGKPSGLAELGDLLRELLGGPRATVWLTSQHRLAPKVHRLRFEVNGLVRSLVVKRLMPDVARRNQLVARRWLPAVGLGHCGPPLLGVAGERSGQRVWHVYEDLGDWTLDETAPDPARLEAAVKLMAEIHTRFAGSLLLAECRRWGGDLGAYFYTSNVRDAIRSLLALRPPDVELTPDQAALRDRLLGRLHTLSDEQSDRMQIMAELDGPDTLLHGDLWPKNVLVPPACDGLRPRLIDWDRTGIGPVSYDLSAFLSRLPPHDRRWVLDVYRQSVEGRGWRLPSARDLNRLFQTTEYARLASCAVWSAMAVLESQAEWAFEELELLDQWFEGLEPLLS